MKIAAGILIGLAITAVGAWLASLFVDGGGAQAWIAAGFFFLLGISGGVMAGLFIGAERAEPAGTAAVPHRGSKAANTVDFKESAVAVGFAVKTAAPDDDDDDFDVGD